MRPAPGVTTCLAAKSPDLVVLSREDAEFYEPGPNDNGYDIAAMVAHVRANLGVDVHLGLPFGHMPEKITLPVGGHCALTVHHGKAQLLMSGYLRRG